MSASLELAKVHSPVRSPPPKTRIITAHALSQVSARFHIFTAMILEIQVFWDVTLCRWQLWIFLYRQFTAALPLKRRKLLPFSFFNKKERKLYIFLKLLLCVTYFFFFFFHWHYSPLWALAYRTMSFHFFLSVTNSLHLLTPSTLCYIQNCIPHLPNGNCSTVMAANLAAWGEGLCEAVTHKMQCGLFSTAPFKCK